MLDPLGVAFSLLLREGVPSVTAMAFNPQWWWSAVFLPAAGGLGWLAKYAFDLRQADRVEVREDRSEEWGHIVEMNTRLTNANQALDAKVAQFDPTLAQIQKEYRDTLMREMDGLEALRDLRIRLGEVEMLHQAAERRVVALEPLAAENQRLRALLGDRGIEDQVPRHSGLPWEPTSQGAAAEVRPLTPEHHEAEHRAEQDHDDS